MHRKVVLNRPVALLASIALLAMLLVEAGAMLRQERDFRDAGIGVPSQDWKLDASAPSKTWESPSLHQSIRKAPPATIALLDGAANPVKTVSIDHPGNIRKASNQRLRLISPRAPPQRSISL